MVDGPAREVGADVGLQRLEKMIEIMRNVEHYEKLPLDYLRDVIDQLQEIEHSGMIKVGEHLRTAWLRGWRRVYNAPQPIVA